MADTAITQLWQGHLATPDATGAFGAALADALAVGDWVLLQGDLGAGKTTLARAILTRLGHAGDVPSPTFTLVQTYDAPPLRLAVAHVDLYRLARAPDVAALALEELSDTAALLIEWPERMAQWPGGALLVQLVPAAAQPGEPLAGRTVTLSGDSYWARRLAATFENMGA